jgi:hypothetical protein
MAQHETFPTPANELSALIQVTEEDLFALTEEYPDIRIQVLKVIRESRAYLQRAVDRAMETAEPGASRETIEVPDKPSGMLYSAMHNLRWAVNRLIQQRQCQLQEYIGRSAQDDDPDDGSAPWLITQR